ncbi:hypothetical protein E2562_025086 [Oryza meyeriana var. granulata]|uniref:DUF4283 domain-containing protein n=1 Tax=Oryza meyeriana var. granulata TaxID=110450 RepID=A0A6G1D7K9_9ORYZ|nr:hypothetical protein E2562_025086 [Oryza meyeriana var. granulata]
MVEVEDGNHAGMKTSKSKRIVSVKWKWVPVKHEEDSFIVQFPSKAELQRSMAYGSADVKEWQGKEEGFLLPKIWLRVSGLRKSLREYLNLWAIGTMFGSTQVVDMVTTRKSDFGRILVAVLDPALILVSMDVVIGDHYFELKILKETKGFDDSGEEVEFDFGGDAGEGGGEDKMKDFVSNGNGKKSGGLERMEEDSSSSMKNLKELGSGGNHAALEQNLSTMANSILDTAVNSVLLECTDKVLTENDGSVEDFLLDASSGEEDDLLDSEDGESDVENGEKKEGCVLAVETWQQMAAAAGVVHVTQEVAPVQVQEVDRPLTGSLQKQQVGVCLGAGVLNFGEQWVASCMGAGAQVACSRLGEVQAAAAVAAVRQSPKRASPWLARSNEEDTLLKAKKRTAWKNLDFSKGNFQDDLLDQTVVPAA